MGRSNGQKAQQKRERNAKKAAAGKTNAHSILKTREAAFTIKCEQCLTPFMGKQLLRLHFLSPGNSSRVVLDQHVESKHPKSSFESCFPAFSG
jgi:hypothetical protein